MNYWACPGLIRELSDSHVTGPSVSSLNRSVLLVITQITDFTLFSGCTPLHSILFHTFFSWMTEFSYLNSDTQGNFSFGSGDAAAFHQFCDWLLKSPSTLLGLFSIIWHQDEWRASFKQVSPNTRLPESWMVDAVYGLDRGGGGRREGRRGKGMYKVTESTILTWS